MRQRALGLGVAIIVCFALVSASAAATTKAQKVTKINVSTRAAVVHYLRSIHVNPKHAVVQRGLRNYAGAHCPGTRWTCASTKHTVVQIAKRGGQNRFVCRSSKCVVVQVSGTSHGVYLSGRISAAAPSKGGGNSGVCVKTGSGATTGGGQTCTINQTGSGPNTASIYENTNKVSGLVQTAQYTASITQQSSGSGAAGKNTACVTQNITQDGSTTNTNGKLTAVTLQAIQTIAITQNSLSGNNSAQNSALSTGACDFGSTTLMQSQTQTSTVSATGDITQSMNPSVNGLTGGNVSLDIEQNQASGVKGIATGTNSADFTQTTNQTAIANAKNGKTVNQTQNAPDGNGTTGSPFSGIVGTINQDSKGLSTATVTQSETQCEDAANTSPSHDAPLTGCSHTSDAVTGITLNQTQNGPVGLFTPAAKSAGRVPYYHKGIGTSQQTGAGTGIFDAFHLIQTSEQYTDSSGPGVTIVQVNTMQGDCKSSGDSSATGGSCQASQQATLNGTTNGTTQDGYTAGLITELLIKCTNGHISCIPTPPPAPTFVSGPSDPNPSASAAFNFTDPATGGVHFLCKIDGGTLQENVVDPCSSGTAFFQGYGPHTFKVAASDSHGNVSAYVPTTAFSWTNVPPDPTITSGPDQPNSESTDATFTFQDAESPVNFVCKLDGAATYTACPSTTPTYTGLSLGAHTLLVKATDTSGLYQSIGNAEYDWTVVPYLTFEWTDDGASAGWTGGVPGSSIDLTVGSDPGTYGQFTLHNFEGIAIADLPAEPTFDTDTFLGGAPRYEIDLDNGDYLFGYPSNAPYGRSWDLNCGHGGCTPMAQVPWGDIQTAEGSATVTDVLVEADFPPGVSATYNISDFNFDGYDLSFFGNHFQT
jgi:hypothetical protein